jgi:hypothetical protein
MYMGGGGVDVVIFRGEGVAGSDGTGVPGAQVPWELMRLFLP